MTLRSDYLDTSSPLRLKAFFQFCDVANNARAYIASLDVAEPQARRSIKGIMEAMRLQSEQRAVEVLSGESLYFDLVKSALSSETQE